MDLKKMLFTIKKSVAASRRHHPLCNYNHPQKMVLSYIVKSCELVILLKQYPIQIAFAHPTNLSFHPSI